MTGDVGFELINAIFRKVDVCACIKRGVTGIIHVEVHEAGNDRCFNELYANCPREGNCFKHAWVIFSLVDLYMDTPGNSTPNTCVNIDFSEDGIY